MRKTERVFCSLGEVGYPASPPSVKGTQKASFTQPLSSPSLSPTVTKCQPQLMSLVFCLQGTLYPLIHAVASELFMVLTNQGFTSKRSGTPKILYCTVCANGSFAEVKLGIEPLLGAPFICGFQSTWKHSRGEDPLTPSPVFCPQDHSASHSIIKGNGKF